jgi:hypothetical protein
VTEPDDRRLQRSRLLFILGVVIGVAAIIGLVVDRMTGHHSTPPGGCHVPDGATAGTETPPALITTIAAPLGAADAAFTESAQDTTVFGYCYDQISAQQLTAVITALQARGYDQTAGQDPISQTSFTSTTLHPYGVSITVTGTLDAGHPDNGGIGGLSITWLDDPP